MISVKEADKIIAENIRKFPVIEQPIEAALGSVLREDIKADRDLPPFHKALMDGVAIKAAAYKSGIKNFKIKGTQAAGAEAFSLSKDDECYEIMTGAVLCRGADCIVPIENVKIEDGIAHLGEGLKLKRMLNVRARGEDKQAGELIISKGIILGPQHLAAAAAVGKAKLKVSYKPKVAVISTGDELVNVGEDVLPFQIRRSNDYFIKAALDKSFLFESATFHFKDNKKTLLRQISAILEKFDVLVITGGISMGKFDYIPDVMKELGVDILFEKVSQKPGKPFWYGRTKRNQPVFALAGNPLSTQIGTYRHVIPNLQAALGAQVNEEYASLAENCEIDTPFTFYLLAQVTSSKEGTLLATPVPFINSGNFSAAAGADGFLEIPSNKKTVAKGFSARFYRF